MRAIFRDTELEEWFKGCVWAKDGYSGYLPSGNFGSKRLTAELNDLFQIIARPRVQVLLSISEERRLDHVRLRVEPRTFQPGLMRLTKVFLSLTSDFLVLGDEVLGGPEGKRRLQAFRWLYRFTQAIQDIEFRQAFLQHGFERLPSVTPHLRRGRPVARRVIGQAS